MLSLTEWKLKTVAEEKQYYKEMLSEGKELPKAFLAEEAYEEYLIETFSQVVTESVVDLTEEVEIENGLVEYFDFVPSPIGEKYDIEMEVDLTVIDPSVDFFLQLKEALYAEDYDVEYIEEAEKAQVVFSRGSGGIEKKKKCAPGLKLKGNKCVAQAGTEKAQNKKQGIKLKKAQRARGAADKKKAAIKAQITKKRVSSKARNYSGT